MNLMLPSGFRSYVGWNWTLCRMLASSGVFHVSEKTFPTIHVPGTWNNNWTLLEIDQWKIGLDTWDTYAPTSAYFKSGLFEPGGLLSHLDVILKIQYYRCPFWDAFTAQTGVPVHPWTVMPSAEFPLGYFQWGEGNPRLVATVAGKNSRTGRPPWVDLCRAQPDFHVPAGYTDRVDLSEYLTILRNCRWGLILKGRQRAHDGKNRRECEFSSCGMPLALTYKPTYPFPMEAGKHFVLLSQPEDLARLREIDPTPFANASRDLFRNHFSPTGAAATLISLLQSLT